MEINALNEQAEDLTEHDTPPIDQHLLQLNQRWVGIRSRVENFKPTNGVVPQTNGSTSLELSPPTKQKYEYAVINKNRKNPNQVTITAEVSINVDASPVSSKSMGLELSTPETPVINNNVLFVTSPSGDADSSRSLPSRVTDVETNSHNETTSSPVTGSIFDKLVDPFSDVSFPSKPRIGFGDSSDDSEPLDEYRQLLSRVGILKHQLKTSGIEMDQYTHENFTSSQDLLSVSLIMLWAIK